MEEISNQTVDSDVPQTPSDHSLSDGEILDTDEEGTIVSETDPEDQPKLSNKMTEEDKQYIFTSEQISVKKSEKTGHWVSPGESDVAMNVKNTKFRKS